jgi:hypothetical protein
MCLKVHQEHEADEENQLEEVSERPLYVERGMGKAWVMILIGSVVVLFHYHTLPFQGCLIVIGRG